MGRPDFFAVHYQIWSEYRLSWLILFIRLLLFPALLCLTNQFLRGNYRHAVWIVPKIHKAARNKSIQFLRSLHRF